MKGNLESLLENKPDEGKEMAERIWAKTIAAQKNVVAGDGSLDPLDGRLAALSKHLREVRRNQPRVTLAEAREQAKRVMAAARRKSPIRVLNQPGSDK